MTDPSKYFNKVHMEVKLLYTGSFIIAVAK